MVGWGGIDWWEGLIWLGDDAKGCGVRDTYPFLMVYASGNDKKFVGQVYFLVDSYQV